MNNLAAKITPKAVLNAVHNLPTRLDDIYAAAMQRIDDLDEYRRGIALNFLMWVTHTYRPLSIKEIEYATTIPVRAKEPAGEKFDYATTKPCSPEEIEAMAQEDPVDEDEIVCVADLLSMCAGLAVVGEFGTVSLVHHTAKSYFSSVSEKWFPNGGTVIAQACLNVVIHHLKYNTVAAADEYSYLEHWQKLETVPFLAYASRFWVDHLNESHDRHLHALALGIFDCRPHRDASGEGTTSLHVACWLGLEGIVCSLLDSGHDVDARDVLDRTPLMCAAAKGFDVIVDSLLTNGAQINNTDHKGRSALHLALQSEHLKVLNTLLARKDLHVDIQDPVENQRTALMSASMIGHLGMVTALLQREDIDVNSKLPYTALMFAVLGGHVAIVKFLTAIPRIEIDSMDGIDGQTALALAVRTGNKYTVEALLDAGASPKIPDGSQEGHETPLLYAIYKRNLPVVRLLLGRKVTWEARDHEGRSTLQRVVIGLSIEGPPFILENLYTSYKNEAPICDDALAFLYRVKVNRVNILFRTYTNLTGDSFRRSSRILQLFILRHGSFSE